MGGRGATNDMQKRAQILSSNKGLTGTEEEKARAADALGEIQTQAHDEGRALLNPQRQGGYDTAAVRSGDAAPAQPRVLVCMQCL